MIYVEHACVSISRARFTWLPLTPTTISSWNVAVMAGAKIIVSGDGHLLNLGKHGNIEVLSATQFLERLP